MHGREADYCGRRPGVAAASAARNLADADVLDDDSADAAAAVANPAAAAAAAAVAVRCDTRASGTHRGNNTLPSS